MEIGVRELKARASEVLREVREHRARYIVSSRGRPIAAIVPLDTPAPPPATDADAWDELDRLGEEIAERWESPLSSAELLERTRR